jgi:hypothetical protein
MLDRSLRKLGRPGDRLGEYRAYLGLTLEQIEAHYGIKGSTWSYAETEGKAVSSKILDALRRIPPPAGKTRVNFDWLSDGTGEMLQSAGNLFLALEEEAPSYGVTQVLPVHIEQAYIILCEVLDLKKKTPADGDRKAVARILGKAARELARGTPLEEVRQELLADAELFLRILA